MLFTKGGRVHFLISCCVAHLDEGTWNAPQRRRTPFQLHPSLDAGNSFPRHTRRLSTLLVNFLSILLPFCSACILFVAFSLGTCLLSLSYASPVDCPKVTDHQTPGQSIQPPREKHPPESAPSTRVPAIYSSLDRPQTSPPLRRTSSKHYRIFSVPCESSALRGRD